MNNLLPEKSKVLLLITEDWFAISHFKPMISALVAAGYEIAIATTVHSGLEEISALGVRVIPLDFERSSKDPVRQVALAAALRRLIRAEQPALVHAIALKPILLGGLLFLLDRQLSNSCKLVLHLTGVGYSGTTAGPARVVNTAVLHLVASLVRRRNTVLLVENPDDAARILGEQQPIPANVIVLGGAGVDPASFPAMPLPSTPSAGFIGRMIWTKGVDVLVAAHQRLSSDNVDLALRMGGMPDPANPRSLSERQLLEWGALPHVSWLGRVDDVANFWRETGIAVVPSRGGEGLPLSLLEAASCARPLVVSDVPGCRHFVRNECEGLLVPPDDAQALADALRRLASDCALAKAMGLRARQRVVENFSAGQTSHSVVETYRRLLT